MKRYVALFLLAALVQGFIYEQDRKSRERSIRAAIERELDTYTHLAPEARARARIEIYRKLNVTQGDL